VLAYVLGVVSVTCAHCRPIWTVYVQIVFTLREVLKKKKPEPDTLGLRSCQRLSLCFQLLDDSIPSWKNLAEYIGNETITIISSRTIGSTGSDHLVMQLSNFQLLVTLPLQTFVLFCFL